ncbi:CBN-APL-1 protein [Caenorhabditis brenneri]|uniref:CBN-APL-1 protein n=1 Tax=Caenorhabditis brenneri TaxID=135651 RepID=G0M8H0_CAEBE|nr:CBN-APL-1 protein [Caenorhabditis brenneri]
MTVGKLMIGLLIPILVATVYAESSPASKRHEKFIPMVAFSCGYRNQYMTEEGTWKTDDERYATCFSGKLDILKYCRKAYPSMNITNIVEYSHEVSISDWCREEGSPCKWTHSVRPYHCIDGEFHSEALQVPHDCQFSHVNSRDQCNDYTHWKDEAGKQCASKKTKDSKAMIVRSFAVLEPCALDMFTGVEFVCCPNDQTNKTADGKLSDDDDDDDDDDGYEDDYSEESDEKDEGESSTQDPYFKIANWTNEHDDFKQAEQRMDDKHRKKVDKVMKEWGDLETRYNEQKAKDPKGAEKFKTSMNARFQKTVSSLEEEHKRMRKEIESVHEERVQAMLNEKKRDATHDYRQALATHVNKPNKHAVLQSLKAYIRAEEKDRMHTLNRYRHLQKVDAEEAAQYKPTVIHRLRYIDLRINGTLAMLRDFPDLENHVRPIAVTYWKDYREEVSPDVDIEESELTPLLHEEEFKNAKLDVKAPTTTAKPKDADNAKILPTEASTSTSDSEEEADEYYEDEDDEQVKKTPDMKKKVKVVDIKPKESEEIRITVEQQKVSPKLVETSVQTDDQEDEDSSSSSSESDEDEDKNIKELRVDIEPIIDEPASFYRHDKLIQKAEGKSSASSIFQPYVLASAMFITAICIIAFAITNARRRRAMRGFIEVDVYTPEERHVAGMQVNGYENPTYSFFDSKA